MCEAYKLKTMLLKHSYDIWLIRNLLEPSLRFTYTVKCHGILSLIQAIHIYLSTFPCIYIQVSHMLLGERSRIPGKFCAGIEGLGS
jgi:hypothetical protein